MHHSGEFVITETTYTFTAFDPSPLGDDVFAVPEGVVCKNRKNLKPLPPLDGIKFFSSISQTTVITTKQTTTYPFYYDRQANLVRYDVIYQNKSAGSAPSRISVIHDFTQGVQYLINRDNGFCNVTSLNATGSITPDEVVDDQGNYVIASLLHLLSPYNDSASAYVYEGTSTVRGIDAEAWLAFIPMADPTYPNVTLGNVTYLVYFSRDDWVVNGRNSSKQVLRVRVHGTSIWNGTVANQFDYISDIFSYDLEELRLKCLMLLCASRQNRRERQCSPCLSHQHRTLSLCSEATLGRPSPTLLGHLDHSLGTFRYTLYWLCLAHVCWVHVYCSRATSNIIVCSAHLWKLNQTLFILELSQYLIVHSDSDCYDCLCLHALYWCRAL